MMLFAIVGFILTVVAALGLALILIAGLIAFNDRKYNPLFEEILTWWGYLGIWIMLVSLAVWQPLHWAGVA